MIIFDDDGGDSILIMVVMLMMELKRLLISINDDYVNITIRCS